jgi:hypothetical protein
MSRAALGGQAAQQRRGTPDRGEYRQVARVSVRPKWTAGVAERRSYDPSRFGGGGVLLKSVAHIPEKIPWNQITSLKSYF